MIAGIVEIIVDVWIWKKRYLVDEDRREFQLFPIDESLQIIVEDESTKDRFIRFERDRRESRSPSINEIVLIIADNGTTKYIDSFGERRDLHWISIDTDRVDVAIS